MTVSASMLSRHKGKSAKNPLLGIGIVRGKDLHACFCKYALYAEKENQRKVYVRCRHYTRQYFHACFCKYAFAPQRQIRENSLLGIGIVQGKDFHACFSRYAFAPRRKILITVSTPIDLSEILKATFQIRRKNCPGRGKSLWKKRLWFFCARLKTVFHTVCESFFSDLFLIPRGEGGGGGAAPEVCGQQCGGLSQAMNLLMPLPGF